MKEEAKNINIVIAGKLKYIMQSMHSIDSKRIYNWLIKEIAPDAKSR
jgi:hypothetical protein